MRIAVFTDSFWPRVNGVTVSADSFSRALVNAGHEVLIVCPSYPDDPIIPTPLSQNPEKENNLKIVKAPSLPVFINKEDRIVKFDKLYLVSKEVESFNPDVIHIQTEVVLGEFGIWYGRAHNLPIVYTVHTMWEEYGPNYFPMFPVFFVKFLIRKIVKNFLRRAHRVIVPTPQINSVVKKYRDKTHTVLLPTGIEMEMFEHSKEESDFFREKMEKQFPALKEKRIILFAGRVAKEKNIGFLINILPNIIKKHPNIILLIAGNGPDMDFYKEEAQKKGVTDNCVFTGYFDRKDLALVYTIADIFVFPSLTDTQGLVTLEAMLSGTPVVAIGEMGTLTVMGGDNGGFMVKNDETEFTSRVLQLLDDTELHRQKSAEAKIHARAWSIEELTKTLIEIYKESISSYTDLYGKPIKPVWELLANKRWWKINNKIFKKRTKENIAKLRAKLESFP